MKKPRCETSSVDLSLSTQPNLDLKPSVDAEMCVEEDKMKRFKSIGV